MAGSTEPRDHDLVVFVEEEETSVKRDEGSDLLAVLLQLDSHTLSYGGVGLLGLDGKLLDNDSLGQRRFSERSLPSRGNVLLVELLVGPSVDLAFLDELSGCLDSSWLSASHAL